MSQKLATIVVIAVLLGGACRKTEAPAAVASSVTAPASSAQAPLVKVPDVTSAPHFVADGILALQKKGFIVKLVPRENADHLPGTIADQAPDGLSSRPKGSEIRLTVATRGKVDVLDLPEEERKRLTADAADRLRKAFAGDYNVTVPRVAGRRPIDAMIALQQRGLKINLDVISMPGFRAFTVASQGPAAGDAVPSGTSVEIKCVGTENDATPAEIARLTRENQTVLRHANERLDAIRDRQGRG